MGKFPIEKLIYVNFIKMDKSYMKINFEEFIYDFFVIVKEIKKYNK